jgi:hypothetical protein
VSHEGLRSIRIGAGAGFAGDRFEPAVELAERGELDALVFECLAERTIALAHQARVEGLTAGFDPMLIERLQGTLPAARQHGTVLITNGGAAAPIEAARAVRDLATSLGQNCHIAAVTGDDVLNMLDLRSSPVLGGEGTLWDLRDRLVSANAYLGVEGIVAALDAEPAVIVTGRTSDAALFLAPIVHHFGWSMTQHDLISAGTLVGHLLECAGQLTGGYFADGDRKVVPGLARLGFPLAEVSADGSAVFTKLPGTGGRIDRLTCLEQLLYEIEDPHAYLTPDVVANFSQVSIEETAADRVRVGGATGVAPPATLKVSVGVADGFVGQAEISYAGKGCLRRAQMARDIVLERWNELHGLAAVELESFFIGYNSCRPWYDAQGFQQEPPEVRLRLTVRCLDRRPAIILAREVDSLYTNGPAGGGGVTSKVQGSIGIVSTIINRNDIAHEVTIFS